MNLPNFNFETSLLPPGTRFLLGIDEVGRGPLAGPVTIGAFLIDLESFSPDKFVSLGVRDSKLLSHQQRQQIYQHFLDHQFIFKTFSSSSAEIDKQGIATCIYSLMTQAVEHFSGNYDFCLIDGNPIKQIEHRSEYFSSEFQRATLNPNGEKCSRDNVRFVVKGDRRCFSVAAASICAKVVRDEFMEKLDQKFPHYGFSRHKGYGTKQHLEAIKKHGPCKEHRLSFKPFKSVSL